jgi:hypothetical protein
MVEFALVAMIFFTVLLGVMEFGRWMFTLNAAAEATRLGARLAAVCSMGDEDIKLKMQFFLPSVDTSQILIEYDPAGCSANQCENVRVSIVNATFTPLIPFLGVSVPIPPFMTSIPRELMSSSMNGMDNPVCQ